MKFTEWDAWKWVPMVSSVVFRYVQIMIRKPAGQVIASLSSLTVARGKGTDG
jgi:hypothetical protein